MFCEHCGKELPDNAKFCSNCGQSTIQGVIIARTKEEKQEMVARLLKPYLEETDETSPPQNENTSVSEKGLTVWQRIRNAFIKFRCFCCYACVSSTVGTVLLIIAFLLGEPPLLMLGSILLILLGQLFAFLGCPIKLIKGILSLVALCLMPFSNVMILIFYIPLGLIIGAIIGSIVLTAGPCFITIPYCREELSKKLLK